MPMTHWFEEHVPLAPHTTLGLGGPARWLSTATTGTALVEALRWAGEVQVPVWVMGGGSNTLELRAGHVDSKGNFVNPTVSINGGSDTISGRSLINTFAI